MRPASGYLYELHLPGRVLGPYPRSTLVGMRVKGVVEQEAQLRRSDGHVMTVAELVKDRFEMADPADISPAIAMPNSGIWPTYLADFGGGHFRSGALGFTGEGEMRLQGSYLRFSGRMRARLIGSNMERIKVMLTSLSAARQAADDARILELLPARGTTLPAAKVDQPVRIVLEDKDCTREALEQIGLPNGLKP